MSDNKFLSFLEFIQETQLSSLSETARRSLSRVHQHLNSRSLGLITANRLKKPTTVGGETKHVHVTTAENRSNNKALEKDIRDAGYSFIRVKGGYPEADESGKRPTGDSRYEPSYIVLGSKTDDGGKLKDFLVHHGSKYNQDAVLYKHHSNPVVQSISTSDRDPTSPKGTEQPLARAKFGKFGDYFTALHGDADTNKPRGKMTPDERKAHKQASLRKKTFVFESLSFEFSEDEELTTEPENLSYYARMTRNSQTAKGRK